MFYCDPCRIDNDWPASISTSFGSCEMCRKQVVCWNRPSGSLPPSRAYREHELKKIAELNLYKPKALDIDIFGDVE